MLTVKTILFSLYAMLKVLWQLLCVALICLVILTELPAPLGIGIVVALFVETLARAGKAKT